MIQEPGVLLFMFFVAALGFGLLYFTLRDALQGVKFFSPRSAPLPTTPERTGSIDPKASEPQRNAAPGLARERSEEPSNLTEDTLRLPWHEIVKGLAVVEMLDDEGRSAPLSKKRIAFLVGRRQEDVSPLIDEARGEKPPVAQDGRFPESTKDGRPVASHLRA